MIGIANRLFLAAGLRPEIGAGIAGIAAFFWPFIDGSTIQNCAPVRSFRKFKLFCGPLEWQMNSENYAPVRSFRKITIFVVSPLRSRAELSKIYSMTDVESALPFGALVNL